MNVQEKAKSEIVTLGMTTAIFSSLLLREGIDTISERGFASSGGITLLLAVAGIVLGMRGIIKAKQWSGSK